MLLMEFHGSEAGVKEQAETVQDLARDHGGEDFQWASTPEERTKLWTARHKAYFAALQTRPGCRCQSSDTCVPISRLAAPSSAWSPVALGVDAFQVHAEAPQPGHVLQHLLRGVVQRAGRCAGSGAASASGRRAG
jgi:hypothetical protein